MHFVATVVKADTLFEFAETEELADYWAIRDLIDSDHARHHLWMKSCFTIGRDALPDWRPRVQEMVRRYMSYHDIEVLVIVTGRDAHLIQPPRRNQ